jgi:3-isopropylmalate/(R)-2-methylmalate dehydratase large subunit
MEERMTLCNMGIEGGARSCYINPDQKTFDYLRGRPYVPAGDFDRAVEYWKGLSSGEDAQYDDLVDIDVSNLDPMITWGVSPDEVIGIEEKLPQADEQNRDAFNYMGIRPGGSIQGTKVDVVFIGSCTNGRLNDLKAAAEILMGQKVSARTLIVPGSEKVKLEAEEMGLDRIFSDAGAEWRGPGCSMCLAMNPDRLEGKERSVSTSNRNFKGRQGSPAGRTHLASPITAAACAIEGSIVNPLKYM